ncbi:MAG: GxxExxY protein [Candidatus Hatepunaea meridiana]|nr:GxxExxY protein [Candidatus Hatepunaea meridiana]
MEISQELNKLTYAIIGACMKVHSGLGPGFPEDYYQRALEYEFEKQKISFEAQKDIQVLYDGVQVGLNYLDFVVDEQVIVEIKSVRSLDDVHRFQVLKYFAATEYPIALLINFGQTELQHKRLLPPKKIQERKKY